MLQKFRILVAMLSMAKLPVAIALFSGLCAAEAYAGVILGGNGVEVSRPSAILVEPSPPAPNQRRQPGQILRCWNNGRLVYEAGGFRAGMEHGSGAVAFPRAAEGHPVTVFDMREGMCILSAF